MGERAATIRTAPDPPAVAGGPARAGLAAHLPHLGADVRVQPGVRALPFQPGRRDPRELAAECRAVIDELARMQVFYVNIGGGEPTVRPDFMEILDYAVGHGVGVKFSTNGVKITPGVARRLAATDYVDVQISLDGATAEVNDPVRGTGSYATAMRAIGNLAAAGFTGFKISVVVTRHNAGQLDAFKELADRYGAQLRLTRLRPAGRGAAVWRDLHPTAAQQRELYRWLLARGEQVLTGDSFFHLAGYGDPLPGLGMCGAGRVVCLIDPVGDVYACPFTIHEDFLAGNVRDAGGFTRVWRDSPPLRGAAWPAGGARASRAGCSTPAGAGAWPPVLHRPSPGWPRSRMRAGPREPALAGRIRSPPRPGG